MMARRRGFSLMEMLVVMSVMSLITTIAVTTIWALMRVEGRGAESLSRSMTLSRLADTFRSDVRAAVAAKVVGDADTGPNGLSLTLPGGRLVVYAASDEGVERSLPGEGPGKHGEMFRLPGGETRFEFRGNETLLGLVHRRRPALTAEGTTITPAREVQIWAAVARDHRFQKDARNDSQR